MAARKTPAGTSATSPETLPETTKPAIKLPKLDIRRCAVHIKGNSSIIFHAWDAKTKQMMLDKQTKRAKEGGSAGRAAKSPFNDFLGSLYLTKASRELAVPSLGNMEDMLQWARENLKVGFPAVAFKAAAVDACSKDSGLPKTVVRQAFHVEATDGDLVVLDGDGPYMREDMVRVGMGTADIRHRGELRDWSARLLVNYNANLMSPEALGNIMHTAGYGIGIGEWRPSCNGQFGVFGVTSVEDLGKA